MSQAIRSVEVFHSAFNSVFRYVGAVKGEFTGDEVDALEKAYERTNTIQGPWVENEEVEVSESVAEAGGARSTSVDDYMRVNFVDPSQDELWFRVSGFGFKQVRSQDVISLLTTDEITGHKMEEMTFEMLKRKMS
jgi:hypothetical protein